MRNLLSFFPLPLLVLVFLAHKIGTHTHNKTQPEPTQYTFTNLPTWCTNKVNVTTQPRIRTNSISNPKLQLRVPTTVQVKATDNHHRSGSLHYNPKVTPCCCCTSTTQAQPPLSRSSTMTKALTTTTNKTTAHSTRARSAAKKKNDAAADDLQKIVAAEKKVREDKKKKRADEKKAEEETKKKSDEEKAQAKLTADQEKVKASSATISPPNPDIALEDGATEDYNWTEDEDDQCLQTHGISPNHLFAKEATTNVPEKLMETLDLTGENSPFKKKSRNTSSSLKSNTRYSTSTFSLTQKVHVHTHAKTFIEAAITLKSEDKPKEFIAAIKLLLANGKFLDSNLALTPLKHSINITKPKLILREDDVPVNFTHLGQYVYTSGNRIFEKKKNWKAAPSKTAPQRYQ